MMVNNVLWSKFIVGNIDRNAFPTENVSAYFFLQLLWVPHDS